MDEQASKICTRCSERRPLDEFYRSKRSKDGRTWQCAPCARAYRSEYGRANRARETAYTRDRRSSPAGREAYSTYMREWRVANAEKVRENAARWNAENADHLASLKHAWYEANKDRILYDAQNDPEAKARRKAANRRWKQNNREKHAENQRKRRVDKLGLRVEDVDLEALWTGKCGICGGALDRFLRWPDPWSPSIDHKIPLALAGTHEETNLQWAHLTCNVRKGARLAVS